jgi:hypothetical protein
MQCLVTNIDQSLWNRSRGPKSSCAPFSPLGHRPQHLRNLSMGLGTGFSTHSFLDTIFEVVPQFPAVTAREAVNFVILLLIYVNSTPVFVIEVKPATDFRFISKRQADLQLRKRFLDISPDMKIPVLHGVSAFGTKIPNAI